VQPKGDAQTVKCGLFWVCPGDNSPAFQPASGYATSPYNPKPLQVTMQPAATAAVPQWLRAVCDV